MNITITKLSWIKSLLQKLREQGRKTAREYLDFESHCFWENVTCLKKL
jgi:hypothetical protein